MKSQEKASPQVIKRAQTIIRRFNKYYPDVRCALNYETPEQLLIATILSAQCTDERVNQVTVHLFDKYKSVADFAKAKPEILEVDIHSTGFYRNKAKNIIKCCQVLMEEYGGKLPQDIESLVRLAGVGRKTANVVLGVGFGISSGVVVDTHVTRLSNRLGLAKGKNAVILERKLNTIISKKHWIRFPLWMIHHGRKVCKARKALCEECFLSDLCPTGKKLVE